MSSPFRGRRSGLGTRHAAPPSRDPSAACRVPIALLLAALACAEGRTTIGLGAAAERPPALVRRGAADAPPTGATATLPADDGQWTIPQKDFAGTRFSALGEITAANARDLRVAWTFSTGRTRGHEGAPLVVGTTMYLVTPFPNALYALDLAQPGAPIRWKYEPPYLSAAEGVACCDLVNRGPAYADGRLYYATLDNQVVAVDAGSGAEVWRVRIGDIGRGETMTMAPLVVKGKVIVGNSGGELGVRGWVTALDAATGRIAWRAYSTGPDAEVLIGPEFRPFYAKDRGANLGQTTWPPDMWRTGGGTVWGWLTYDPALDLLYHGTGNAGPWNPDLRPGDNKWTAAIFARDPDDGTARWAYQIDPHNEQDYDAVNESLLLEMPVAGQPRRVLVRHERNGYMYVIDRATGEVLSADTVVYTNTVTGVDLTTGQPGKVREKAIRMGEVVREICPAVSGSKNWSPMSFSPRLGLLFVPFNNLCMDAQGTEANYIAGTPYLGSVHMFKPGPGGHRGGVFAWDPVGRRKAWQIEEPYPLWSGTLVTAGDVMFYGTMDRWFKAVNARTGETLWRFRTGSGIVGQPISYRGPDGKQYVAVFDGVGGWAGSPVVGDKSPSDSFAADGFMAATASLRNVTREGGTLYVFALP